MRRLFKLLPCAALATAATVACTARPPSALMPDGRTRQSINTPERIAAYTADNKPATVNRPLPADHSAQAAPPRQLAQHGKQRGQQDSTDTSAVHLVDATDAGLPRPRLANVAMALNELLELRPRSLVFSIPCAFGTADCPPSAHLSTMLLSAAAQSPRIEIRGRTDAALPNQADQYLAQRRAQKFKESLVQQGVGKLKLHTSALAAGGHVADNSTAAGRAKNRRVEIEIMDLDPELYGSIPTGEHNEPD